LIGGRFRLHRLLGSGAMGQVWLATDERLQRSVAVKIVLPDATDAQLGLRLEREARAAAAIQHTNVVRVFDYLEDAGRTLIVMEHVEGETLADRLERDGALSIEDSLDLAAQICDGLSAAHRTGLVHRDLKPSNVMVTEDGLAKVLDFGIAKRTGTGRGEKNLTMTGAVIGTPRYMAPEQLRGEELDARVDVHAAGLLLYEMMAGRPAFDRENFAELMYQLVNTGADMGPLEARGVPPEVIGILSRALAKHRDDRWPDAKAMSDALRVCLFGDVMHSRRTPSTAGLRGIIDSGERLLQRTTGSSAAVPEVPVAATSAPSAPMSPTPPAGTPVAPPVRTELIDRRQPSPAPAPAASPRWPLVAVPALILAVVAAVVFMRKGAGTDVATSAPATPEPVAAATAPAPGSGGGSGEAAVTGAGTTAIGAVTTGCQSRG
jgi:eukaryotic-like serine/threonine-protein kinase